HMQTRAADTYAQVAVLSDVVRVPAAEPAQHLDTEVVGGAAQRDEGPRAANHAGQQHVVPLHVVAGEEAREHALAHVVEIQARLQADDTAWLRAESRCRLAELVRLRAVLGVVDDNQLAARSRESNIERAGLGARLTGRDGNGPNVQWEVAGIQATPGLLVV